jgi:hypothetical protein
MSDKVGATNSVDVSLIDEINANRVSVNADGSIGVAPLNNVDRSGSGTITALNGVVTANTQGCSTVIFNVTGTWTATLTIEGTVDGGATWVSVIGLDQSQAVFSVLSANARVYVGCGGFSQIRLEATAFTSGTASITWDASVGSNVMQVWNTNASSLRVQSRTQDNSGNGITSQANGAQRALDIGVNVAGVQVDPRAIRLLTSSDVVTSNIGTTNGLALDATLAKLTISQGGALGSNTQALVGGSVTTAAPTYTTGQISPLSLDTTGALRVNLASSTATAPAHTVDSAGDTYVAGTTKGSLDLGRVIDPSTPPTLTIGQLSGLTLDTAGSLNVHVTTSTTAGSNPAAVDISSFVNAGKVYTITAQVNMASSAIDNPLVLIKNPVASGKKIYLYKIIVACDIANVTAIFKYFYDPTITANGGALASSANNIGGGGPASAMSAFTLPTVSANGTAMAILTYGQNSNSLSSLEDMSISLAANHNIMITGRPASNAREATITAVWVEI